MTKRPECPRRCTGCGRSPYNPRVQIGTSCGAIFPAGGRCDGVFRKALSYAELADQLDRLRTAAEDFMAESEPTPFVDNPVYFTQREELCEAIRETRSIALTTCSDIEREIPCECSR